jgi:hypothetical protein
VEHVENVQWHLLSGADPEYHGTDSIAGVKADCQSTLRSPPAKIVLTRAQ